MMGGQIYLLPEILLIFQEIVCVFVFRSIFSSNLLQRKGLWGVALS